MRYTAYTEEELEKTPPKYKRIVCGVSDCGEILQPPICPECGDYMTDVYTGYLSCTTCGCIRKMRILG